MREDTDGHDFSSQVRSRGDRPPRRFRLAGRRGHRAPRSEGYRLKIVCLSYGERGESQWAWKSAGVRLEDVKAQRRAEAEEAAAILGAEIEFFDVGDYPCAWARPSSTAWLMSTAS